ncbi:MAG TPA: hypothetical protein VGB53_00810 [Rubricoccaceae bacterium]|jgi:hypothetical protein
MAIGAGVLLRTSGQEDWDRELQEELDGLAVLGHAEGIVVTNTAPHARFLRRYGIVVVDEVAMGEELDVAVESLLARTGPLRAAQVRSALKLAAFRSVARMQSFTGGFAPALYEGGPVRPQHPGGYADVTTDLASSYTYAVAGDAPTPAPYDGRPFSRRVRRTSAVRRTARARR